MSTKPETDYNYIPQAVLKQLGQVAYEPTWHAMQHFTDTRPAEQADEFWCLEHPAIFTLGRNGDESHVLAAGDIPTLKIDRGGQVTYHGPGQLVMYTLVNVDRLGIGPRGLVTAIENALISLLADFGITANADPKAPGVYTGGKKMASLGLRIRNGCSFHGLALNCSMDMEPYQRINPCGYQGLEMTQLSDFISPPALAEIGEQLFDKLKSQLYSKGS